MSDPFDSCREAWPHDRVLYEDDALLVLDKPAGLSTDGGPPADVLHRARAYLAAKGIANPYVSAVYHLPRDVSGVVVLSRAKAHNALLAAQCARELPGARVRALVARGHDGDGRGARRAPSHRPGDAGPAAANLAVRELPLRLGSGRGFEGLRDGVRAVAPLHLARVALAHPRDGVLRVFTAGDPPAFSQRSGESPVPSVPLLREAAMRRYGLFLDATTDAFRLVNELGDGAPRVALDRYGAHAVVHVYAALDPPALEALLDAVAAAYEPAGIYVKHRPRVAHTLADTRRDELASRLPLRGAPAPDEFVVREEGMRLRVRLGDGLSTGVFLDQRANRRRVRAMARGRAVLNLFGYTGAFSVAAALGGAARTVTVDAAAPAIAWAQRNLGENGFDDRRAHATHAADAFGWLEGARARRERYDLAVLDPPAFATTRDGTRFSAESNYAALIERTLAVLAPDATLLVCTNHRGVSRAKLRRVVTEAARAQGRAVAALRESDPADDFLWPSHEEPPLKSLWVTLGAR